MKAVFSVGETIIFRGIASDADVASSALTFDWNLDKDGALGTGSINSDGELSFPMVDYRPTPTPSALNVTDEMEFCTDTIIISVGTAPVVNLVFHKAESCIRAERASPLLRPLLITMRSRVSLTELGVEH